MSKISSEEVRKVAELARLELPEEQICAHTLQLEKILDYVAQLEEVETTNVVPTTRAVEVTNITRNDLVVDTDSREDLLKLAPRREGDFYRVPKIIAD